VAEADGVGWVNSLDIRKDGIDLTSSETIDAGVCHPLKEAQTDSVQVSNPAASFTSNHLQPVQDDSGFPQSLLDRSPHYHSKDKGCRIINIHKSFSEEVGNYKNKFCRTHKVILGRAGWTLGFYGGTESKTLLSREEIQKRIKAGKAYPLN
jgi:hypothetical protein